jgi:hypothetical protein
MASARLLNLMGALRKLAADNALAGYEGSLAAERAIQGYLGVTDPAKRKQMLDELDHEVAAETGEFWDTVRDIISQQRQTR